MMVPWALVFGVCIKSMLQQLQIIFYCVQWDWISLGIFSQPVSESQYRNELGTIVPS